MSKDKPFRLPVLPDNMPAWLDEPARAELTSLNLRFEAAKTRLKDLETEKGVLSRKIGEAKRQQAPIDDILTLMQSVSEDVTNARKSLQLLNARAIELLDSSETAPRPGAPAHFLTKSPQASPKGLQFTIEEASPNDANAWDQFVAEHPNSCAYHQYAFRSVVEQAFHHRTIYLLARNEDRSVCGVLPAVQLKSRLFGNYFVSLPFFNYGGALATHPTIEVALMDAMGNQALSAGASHVEFRDTTPRDTMAQKTDKQSLILELPRNAGELWESIGTKVRAQIKKAGSHELAFRAGGAELLDDFYHVFAVNMRDLGTPVYAKSFFAALLSQQSLNTEICIAYHQGQPVSCGFLLRYRDTIEIPWASTVRSANRLNANMFLYWNILQLAIARGARFFDFGRSSTDAGTFKFKLQWGAKPQQLYWHYWLQNGTTLPALNPNNPKFALAIAVWQRLPVWITKLIGPHLVKNLP